MLNKTTVQLMALGLIGSMAATSFADDSALIDALVRKGVLKKGEAEQIRAQACKDCASDKLSGKVSLGESVSSLKLTGDLRVRYQYSNNDAQGNDLDANGIAPGTAASSNNSQNSGFRLRLRVNADYQVDENFFAGFGLGTAPSGIRGQSESRRSAETSLANNYYSGYNIEISKAFIGWTPTPGVTIIAGKQENPFYTTDMVWGSEVNPSGFTQQIDLNKVFGFSGIGLKVNSGQFIVQDNSEAAGNVDNGGVVDTDVHNRNRDAYIWQTQVVATVDLGSKAKLTVAPGFYSSNGASSNTGTLENLQIVLLPGDVSAELGGQKVKFLWDLAYNLDGANRSQSYFTGPGNDSGTDKLAWLLGAQVGENKKKGDWSFAANYRRVGVAAVDHVITDQDFAFGDVNATGFKVGFTYNVGNATTVGLNYYNVDNLRKDLGFDNSSQIIQADVSVKF